jgi:hypothetical protein
LSKFTSFYKKIADFKVLFSRNTISFHELSRKYSINAKKCLYKGDYGVNTFIHLKWLLCKTLPNDQVQLFIEQSSIHSEQINIIKSAEVERLSFRTSDKVWL